MFIFSVLEGRGLKERGLIRDEGLLKIRVKNFVIKMSYKCSQKTLLEASSSI